MSSFMEAVGEEAFLLNRPGGGPQGAKGDKGDPGALAPVYASVADALSQGVASVAITAAGSGAANGTYAWTTTGGGGTGAAGYLVVAGGAVASVVVEHRGRGYTSSPTIVIGGTPGFGVAPTLTPARSQNRTAGAYFVVPVADGYQLYVVDSGGTTATSLGVFDTRAKAQSTAAQLSLKSLWPDPSFRATGGHADALVGGYAIYSRAFTNRNWDPTVKHSQGVGAWVATPGSGLQGHDLYFDMPGAAELAIKPGAAGEVLSFAAIVKAPSGTVNLLVRFFDAIKFDPLASPQIGYVYNGLQLASGLVTMDGTEKVLKVEDKAVPTGAIGAVVYLNQGVSSAFQTCALWAVRGAIAGDRPPVVATQQEVKELTLPAAIDAVKSAFGETLEAAAWAMEPRLAYDALAPVLESTARGMSSLGAGFTAFGQELTRNGKTFNAIAPFQLRTALGCVRLHAVLKIGPVGAAAAGRVVAVASAPASPDETVHLGKLFVLRDLETREILTFTDAQLGSANYFVGYYGTDANGNRVNMDLPGGTMPNKAAISSYMTLRDPLSGYWSMITAGTAVAVDHVLLTNPRETGDFTPEAVNRMAEAIGDQGGRKVEILTLPPVLYGIQGDELNVYLDNLVYASADRYYWDIDLTALGEHQDERWTLVPAGAADESVRFRIFDPENGDEELHAATANLKCVAYPPAVPKSFVVLTFGDSLIAANVLTQSQRDLASAPGSNTTLTLIGSRGTGANRHEGRGGYRIDDFTTAGRTFQSFLLSSVAVAPAINSPTVAYMINGRTYTPQDVLLDGSGNGTIIFSFEGGTAPPASGVLTKVGGGIGDTTLTYSETAAASGNPIWDGTGMNLGAYLSVRGLADPTHIEINLGINSMATLTSDAAVDARIDEDMPRFEAFVAHCLGYGSLPKVGIYIPTAPAAMQSAAGESYGAGINRARMKRNILRYAKALIARFRDRTASRIYLIGVNAALDPVYGYDFLNPDQAASAYSAKTRPRQFNLVHPGDGYVAMGHAAYAWKQVVG